MAGLLLVFAPFAAGDMAISVNQEAVQTGVPDAVGVPNGDDIQITVDLTEPEKSEVEQIVVTGEFLVDVRDGLSGMAVYQDPPDNEPPPAYDRYSIRWAGEGSDGYAAEGKYFGEIRFNVTLRGIDDDGNTTDIAYRIITVDIQQKEEETASGGFSIDLNQALFLLVVVILVLALMKFRRSLPKSKQDSMDRWREDPAEEMARLVDTKDLNDFWTSNIDLIIGPGESAVTIRDGSIEDIVTQQKLDNVAGGFYNWLGDRLKTKKNLQLLFVDNKPFKIEIGIEGLTNDDLAQSGVAKLIMRLDHERSNRLLGVLREKKIKVSKGFFRKTEVIVGYETCLTRTEIEQMLAEEARAKVFKKIIGQYRAKDLGSSGEIDEKVAAAARLELRKTLDLWGMSIENIYVEWSLNAYQVWKTQRAPTTWIRQAEQDEAEREQIRQIEFQKRRRVREKELEAQLKEEAEKEEISDIEFQKRRRVQERGLESQEKEWDEVDKTKALEAEAKQLAHQRTVSVEKTRLKSDLESIEQEAALKKKRKSAEVTADIEKDEAERDREELEGLIDVKARMQEQKLTAKEQDQEHEKEMAKIKADVDKTVGTAQAGAEKAKAEAAKAEKESEDRKKKREKRFLVEAVYLIYNDGRLLAKSLSEKQETDAEILTGMLSAVGDFVSDSLGTKGHLGTMQHGDSTILIEQGKECHLAAITYGKPGKGLKKALRKQLSVIEDEYIKDLKDWNGDVSLFADCTTNLVKIILQSTAKSRSEAD